MNNKAIIFDMDGLLIDSEPLWKKSEVKIYGSVGIPMTLEMTNETMGMRCDEVTKYWHRKYPWKEKTVEEVTDELVYAVIEMMKNEGKLLSGVEKTLEIVRKMGVKIAIVSSSSLEMINVVVDSLNLGKFDLLYSAENEIHGKPAPDVYLSASKILKIPVENCIALEDSLNGVRSAKAAGMKCIAVPDERYTPKIEMQNVSSDFILDSLEDFSEELILSILNS